MEIKNTVNSQKREIIFISHVSDCKIFAIVKMNFSFRIDELFVK